MEIRAEEASAFFGVAAHDAVFAGEVDGMADDDGGDAGVVIEGGGAFEFEDDVEDGAGDLAWDAAGASGERLRGDAQGIGDGEAEAGSAYVNGEDTHGMGIR